MGRQSIRFNQINQQKEPDQAAAAPPADDRVLSIYMGMSWNDIRKTAAERGVAVLGRKKHQIAADLAKLEQG